MKAINYDGTFTIEEAAKRRLSQHDYYSRGVEAAIEKINNLIDLNAKLISLLAEHKVLDAALIGELLNMSIEDDGR